LAEAEGRPRRKRFAIGIDPPRGLAAYNRDTQKLERLMSVTFWDIIDTLDLIRGHYDITVVCEAPQKNIPVWVTDKRGSDKNKFIYARVCQDVGRNKQCAILIIEWCERHKIECIAQKPGRSSITKLNKEDFDRITGWHGTSNEHTRDAAMLVWGL